MNSNDRMVRDLKAGDRYYHRGVLKTVRYVIVLTNTVDVTFEDGSKHFVSRGTIITLV